MNLQEQIRRILKEETKMNLRLRRRFAELDNEFHRLMSAVYTPNYICRYKSGEELLDVVSEAVIGFMYWNYFDDIDYNSEEWGKIYNNMIKYLSNKYREEIKEYYHISCGD